MASRPGRLDSALVNLRARTLDLHERLAELREALIMLRDGVGPGRLASWPTFLSKFDTLSKLYSQLTKELDRAVREADLVNFVLEPHGIAEDVNLVPDLLRTKLMPEMEKELEEMDEEWKKERERDAVGSRVNGERIDKRIGEFNAFIGLALERFAELREELAPQKEKGEGRKEDGDGDSPTVEQMNRVLGALEMGQGL